MQIIHSQLWGVATPGKLGLSSGWALCFSFLICSSPFCFLLTVFYNTFSMSCKILPYYVYYYYCPPRGQWMDYSRRLVKKFIHCFREQRLHWKMGLSYSLGLWDFHFFVPALFLSMLMHLFLYSSLSQSFFILAVPMCKCLGKCSCMSSSFPIVILNDTCFFPTVQLQVHIVYSERKTRNSCALVNLCL